MARLHTADLFASGGKNRLHELTEMSPDQLQEAAVFFSVYHLHRSKMFKKIKGPILHKPRAPGCSIPTSSASSVTNKSRRPSRQRTCSKTDFYVTRFPLRRAGDGLVNCPNQPKSGFKAKNISQAQKARVQALRLVQQRSPSDRKEILLCLKANGVLVPAKPNEP